MHRTTGWLALAAAGAMCWAGASIVNAQSRSKQNPDASFLREAAQGGMEEVVLGKLAVERGTDSQVKDFGQHMVDDHGKANDELKTLASQKGVTVPEDLKPDAKKLMARFSKLSGTAFDRAYMTDMVKDHQKDVAAFKTEAKKGKDADVRKWAAQTLPTLESHLKMAKDVSTVLKTSGAKHASMKMNGTAH